jgi:hypothetical protein
MDDERKPRRGRNQGKGKGKEEPFQDKRIHLNKHWVRYGGYSLEKL